MVFSVPEATRMSSPGPSAPASLRGAGDVTPPPAGHAVSQGSRAAQATRQPRPQRGHTSPLPEATLLLAVCPGSHAVCASVRRRCSHRSDVQGVAMKRSVLVETCGGPEGAAVSPNHPCIPQQSPAAPCSPPPSPEVPRRPSKSPAVPRSGRCASEVPVHVRAGASRGARQGREEARVSFSVTK